MTAMPKISVIMPVYNVEPYLRKCLDSVRAQTFAIQCSMKGIKHLGGK